MNQQSNKEGNRTGTYERYGLDDYSKGEREREERKREKKSVDKSKERLKDDYKTNIDCSVF